MQKWLFPLMLILAGVLCGFGLITGLLMALPDLVFETTDYYQRTSANQTLRIQFRPRDGDLFPALPGRIRPPEQNDPLTDFTIRWDADSFRIPALTSDHYPIAVFGDSFTEGYNVATPYADRIAEALALPVRNYGYRAYGPVEVSQAITQFAPIETRDWVIYGYFSGNDLGDALRPPKVDTRSPIGVWSALFTRFNPPDPFAPAERYDFPMPVIIGGNYYDLAFVWYYWWWQIGDPADYAASRNLTVVAESLDRADLAIPSETCKALVFIPTKEQLYYPYIYPSERRWIREARYVPRLAPDQTLYFSPQPIDESQEAAFIATLDHQHDAIARLIATRPDWVWIDLMPAFERAVAEGQLLYYPYDSHWNQAGHDLAGRVIAEALRAHPECFRPS
ncbi:MAG: hypothetical protein MUF87_09345 [Anaerolineae bacterium]|jgi:hypothetical protein|nr:hypothetical protein [Anaerolineae bacterium]